MGTEENEGERVSGMEDDDCLLASRLPLSSVLFSSDRRNCVLFHKRVRAYNTVNA